MKKLLEWAVSALDGIGHDLETGAETKAKVAKRAHERAADLRKQIEDAQHPLVKALAESQKELRHLAKDLGGCDHSVNICQCDLTALLEGNAELLKQAGVEGGIMRATGIRIGDLIQTLLRHGNIDYRVKLSDEGGKLFDLQVVSGTDYPAQVILRKAPAPQRKPQKRVARMLVSTRGKVLKIGDRIGLGEIAEFSRSKIRLQYQGFTRWFNPKRFGLRFVRRVV